MSQGGSGRCTASGLVAATARGPWVVFQGLRLPALDLGSVRAEDKVERMVAMGWLDDLLERLERTNLAELKHPPSSVIGDLVQAGLRNPFAYTVPQLIEIVFNTQAPLMHANRAGYSLL